MIRAVVTGLPALFAILILASFFNVLWRSSQKQNEMIVALAGDPQNLNPIQFTDLPSGTIINDIFNGLLKMDENLELAPDLARSWTLSQTTTFFFPDAVAASHALATVKTRSTEWSQWHVTNAFVEGNRLIVRLSLPGISSSHQIASLIDPLPVSVLRVHVLPGNGSARKALAAAQAKVQPFIEALLPEKTWYDYDSAYEATIVGKPEPVHHALVNFHAQTGSQPGKVQLVQTRPFLAEPQIDFKLKQNVRWQDGYLFSARDVVFTFRSIMDENIHSPRKADFDKILKLETPDPYHVRVLYREPYSPALESWCIGILPAHILENKPSDWWATHFNRHPIGTGPFKFEEWKTNESIHLKKNPLYFDTPPWLDRVVYHIIPDKLTQHLAFETRQVDFWTVDPWAIQSIKKNPRYDLYSTPITNNYNYIAWNLRNPIFQDPRLRVALAHALDIPAIVQFILYGQGIQSTGNFTPNVWYFNPNIRPYPYDPNKAAALLQAAGWKPGPNGIRIKDGKRLSFTIITPSNVEIYKNIAALAQDYFRKIGVEIKIEDYEWAVFVSQHIMKLDFEAVVLGWGGGNYDQYQIWSSTQTKPGLLNFIGYASPQADRLLDQIRQEYDRKEIIRLAGELQQTLYADQPYLFLFAPNSTTAMWKNTFRIYRPNGRGGFIETPITPTKAGWSYYSKWFYRPEYASRLPQRETQKNSSQ